MSIDCRSGGHDIAGISLKVTLRISEVLVFFCLTRFWRRGCIMIFAMYSMGIPIEHVYKCYTQL